jgi:tight adherence protein B
MFIFTPGRLVAYGQLAAIFLVVAAQLTLELPMWWALIVLIIISPSIYLESERRKRVIKIEDQLDNFMLALANALKATPSIGAAFNSVVTVIDDPIKSEVDLALKEMKVGSTLDQALLHMASRVGSRQLDSALSSILIGRQVGGNLPKVLETTATTLREMKRLEGVIRTKTADGRMQLWVIGAMPLVFIVGFGVMWPGYFDPLTKSLSGYGVIAFVCTSWVSALILARKVLAVDF